MNDRLHRFARAPKAGDGVTSKMAFQMRQARHRPKPTALPYWFASYCPACNWTSAKAAGPATLPTKCPNGCKRGSD